MALNSSLHRKKDRRTSTMGIQIFPSVTAAVHAGYMIESPLPDSEGFLHARIHTLAGWAQALVRTSGGVL
jgi:hypothetical protein